MAVIKVVQFKDAKTNQFIAVAVDGKVKEYGAIKPSAGTEGTIHTMFSSTDSRPVQQQLALLRQRQRDLEIVFVQLHASLAETDHIQAELEAVATRISELESVVDSPLAKTA